MTKYISVRQQLWQEPVFSPEEGEEFAPTRHQVDRWKAEASNFPATLDELPYGRRDWWDILATRAYQAGRAFVTEPVAEPVAEGPTDEELEEEFGAALLKLSGDSMNATAVAFARAVLARYGRPAAAPVPEPGEVADEELREIAMHCVKGHKSIEWAIKEGITLDRSRRAADLLEAHALPTPETTND